MEKKYIRAKETAEFLGIPINTLYSWVHNKNIDHYKVNGVLLFDIHYIDNYVQQNAILSETINSPKKT